MVSGAVRLRRGVRARGSRRDRRVRRDRRDQGQPWRAGAPHELLFVYSPDELLPVTSKAHIDHFLERLGQPTTWFGGPREPSPARCAPLCSRALATLHPSARVLSVRLGRPAYISARRQDRLWGSCPSSGRTAPRIRRPCRPGVCHSPFVRAGGRRTEGEAAHLLEGIAVVAFDREAGTIDPDLPPAGSGLRSPEFITQWGTSISHASATSDSSRISP